MSVPKKSESKRGRERSKNVRGTVAKIEPNTEMERDGGEHAKEKVKSINRLNNVGDNRLKFNTVNDMKQLSKRERNYLFQAGLHPKQISNSFKEQIQEKEESKSSSKDFATRALGSADAKVRHSAILRLKHYLNVKTDPENSGISEEELLKLWEGLWYGLYMADKAVVQEELSSCLAQLLWDVTGTVEEDIDQGDKYLMEEQEFYMNNMAEDDVQSQEEETLECTGTDGQYDEVDLRMIQQNDGAKQDQDEESLDHQQEGYGDQDSEKDEQLIHHKGVELTLLMFKSYFVILHRHWHNMDRHRIDKMYASIRLMVKELFLYLKSRSWNNGIIHMLHDLVLHDLLYLEQSKLRSTGDDPLLPQNYPLTGIRLHLADIYVEELANACALVDAQIDDEDKHSSLKILTTKPFLAILEPFFSVLMGDREPCVHKRVIEGVLLKFLNQYSCVSDRAIQQLESETDEQNASNILHRVHVGSVAENIFTLAAQEETLEPHRQALYDLHKIFVRKIKLAGTDIPDEDLDDSSADDEIESNSRNGETEELFDHAGITEVEEQNIGRRKKSRKETGTSPNQPVQPSSNSKQCKTEPSVMNQEHSTQEMSEASVDTKESLNNVVIQNALRNTNAKCDQKKDANRLDKKSKKSKKVHNSKKSNVLVLETDLEKAGLAETTHNMEPLRATAKDKEEEIFIKIQRSKSQNVSAAPRIEATKLNNQLKERRKAMGTIKASKYEDESNCKRVKFGPVNRAKSYKASMKALSTMKDPVSPASAQEPILREPKFTASPVVKQGKHKKRKNRD